MNKRVNVMKRKFQQPLATRPVNSATVLRWPKHHRLQSIHHAGVLQVTASPTTVRTDIADDLRTDTVVVFAITDDENHSNPHDDLVKKVIGRFTDQIPPTGIKLGDVMFTMLNGIPIYLACVLQCDQQGKIEESHVKRVIRPKILLDMLDLKKSKIMVPNWLKSKVSSTRQVSHANFLKQLGPPHNYLKLNTKFSPPVTAFRSSGQALFNSVSKHCHNQDFLHPGRILDDPNPQTREGQGLAASSSSAQV